MRAVRDALAPPSPRGVLVVPAFDEAELLPRFLARQVELAEALGDLGLATRKVGKGAFQLGPGLRVGGLGLRLPERVVGLPADVLLLAAHDALEPALPRWGSDRTVSREPAAQRRGLWRMAPGQRA